MKDFSYITNSSPAFIESLYQDFVKDPSQVDPELRKFFEGFDFAISNTRPGTNGNGTQTVDKKESAVPAVSEVQIDWMKEIQVYRMILGYRNKGHLIAKTIRSGKEKTEVRISILVFLDFQKKTWTNNLTRETWLA